MRAARHRAESTMIGKHDPAHHRQHDDENANPEAGANLSHVKKCSRLMGDVKQARSIQLRHEAGR